LSSDQDESPFVRAFIAVEINEDVRREICRVQDRLKRIGSHVSWVRPENIHLTFEFLGDLARDRIVPVAGVIDRSASESRAFSLEVRGVGSFGRAGSPRVVWVGVGDSAELCALHARAHRGLTDLGIGIEGRPFRPHMTIGRVRSSRGRKELSEALVPLGKTDFGVCGVRQLTLMQSRLRPGGPEYSPLHVAPLGG